MGTCTSAVKHLRTLAICILLMLISTASVMAAQCERTITADVVALDQPFMFNRLGAAAPDGMVFALARDIIEVKNGTAVSYRLRADKRPRPLVLRANQGDCLQINFRNLLKSTPGASGLAANTRYAGLHIMGLELVQSINSSASWVGANNCSLAPPYDLDVSKNKNACPMTAPGDTITYTYYAAHPGVFLFDSGADGTAVQTDKGLFGSVNVQPREAEWYRSQVTRTDMALAGCEVPTDIPLNQFTVLPDCPTTRLRLTAKPTVDTPAEGVIKHISRNKMGRPEIPVTVRVVNPYGTESWHLFGPEGSRPIVNYQASYPADAKYLTSEDPIPVGTPILNMLQVNKGSKIGSHQLQRPLNDYVEEILEMVNGMVPQNLLPILKEKGLKLSDDLSATPGNGYRATVTDKENGKTYLIEVVPGDNNTNQLNVYPATLELVHGDLTAIITGPNAGEFPQYTFPDVGDVYPDRSQPYREFSIFYHQPLRSVTQAFPQFNETNVKAAYDAGQDGFAINYGTGGIAAEILANRLGVGPMGHPDAVDLKYEEFFLSAWSVGDPAMVVDKPANASAQVVSSPGLNPPPPPRTKAGIVAVLKEDRKEFRAHEQLKATKAFYPDDPSNVYHSYLSDHVKFRILHAGSGPSHVHHLHAQQWLHSPNSDNSHYLDSQMLVSGSTYTLDIVYNGSGNRNKTVGDSIFHCHFYPHFAQGMWAMWRVHDVFELGTELDAKGMPLYGKDEQGKLIWNRSLPDGEIVTGTPIPGMVPLPTIPMAPVPAKVRLANTDDSGKRGEYAGRISVVEDANKNPGYPFFIPGVAGHRAPHPAKDFAWMEDEYGDKIYDQDGQLKLLDGGLPRHVVLDGKIVQEVHTRWDFTKDFAAYSTPNIKEKTQETFIAGGLTAFRLPEDGTPTEQAAMAYHATCRHPSIEPDGQPAQFRTNGLPAVPGAPYANPPVTDNCEQKPDQNHLRYQAAVVQRDVVLNKKGWHYPQQRFLTLWGDVEDTFSGERPPQPFFFRSNSGDTIQFWHTDLVPFYYDLDDFQVRTPTDVIGQHIHLVKFDVTASDGAANGFNYEDGTFSPDEVRDRIHALNGVKNNQGIYDFDPVTQFQGSSKALLSVKTCEEMGYPFCDAVPADQNWHGAQTTIQLWDADTLANKNKFDRTMRTVFTHDHFGPSTHQQVGLYAGLLIEPENSHWFLPDMTPMHTRPDGGPTNWAAIIEPRQKEPVSGGLHKVYREFALEFQDLQLAYTNSSPSKKSSTLFIPEVGTPNTGATAVWLTLTIANTSDLNGTDGTDQVPPPESPPTCSTAKDCVPEKIREQFAQAGVVLSPNATIASLQAKWWQVDNPLPFICPAGAPADCEDTEHYPIEENAKGYFAYAASIHPNWAWPQSAINAAFTGALPCTEASNELCAPYVQLINATAANWGTFSLNYRNEPTSLRVKSGNAEQTDLASVFRSIERADADLNTQPVGTPINPCKPDGFKYPSQPLVPLGTNGVQPTDPYTPLLRAYTNDRVQIRTLVGAHQQSHSFTLHGLKWLFEPSFKDSGFRSAQGMGLSEHFEMIFTLPPAAAPHAGMTSDFADYFYGPSSSVFGLLNGDWGILRAYKSTVDGLAELPTKNVDSSVKLDFEALYNAAPMSRKRSFAVTATTAKKALGTPLFYNERGQKLINDGKDKQTEGTKLIADATKIVDGKTVIDDKQVAEGSKLVAEGETLQKNGIALFEQSSDPNALIYVQTGDLDANGKLKPGVPIEPLMLRAAAGDWIKIELTNALPATLSADNNNLDTCCQSSPFRAAKTGQYPTPPDDLMPIPLKTSSTVGLHPQKVAFDVTTSNGVNVGFNPVQTVASGGASQTYYLYAGTLKVKEGCSPSPADNCIETPTPVEFGATGLSPADLLLQHQKGLYGALIIEPEGSSWIDDANTRAAATVTKADGSVFRHFVAILQNDVENSRGLKGSRGAVNYRFETSAIRGPLNDGGAVSGAAPLGNAQLFANSQVLNEEPSTPIFQVAAGIPSHLSFVFPGGMTVNRAQRPFTVTVDGHVWQEEPYVSNSTEIGDNDQSEYMGTQTIVPYQNVEVVLPSSGGKHRIAGDYLYGAYQLSYLDGTWGLFRVQGGVGINMAMSSPEAPAQFMAGGTAAKDATSVDITFAALRDGNPVPGGIKETVSVTNGNWSFKGSYDGVEIEPGTILTVSSSNGTATAIIQVAPPGVRVSQR